MKNVFILNGSPRPSGNTSYLIEYFKSGAEKNKAFLQVANANELNLAFCNGCLRCNLIKRCSIKTDDWPEMSDKILQSDILVFASPVYFHHFPASVKAILDRFRSFVKVTITEDSLDHQAWTEWDKDFVLLLTMGSSDDRDAQPIIELFDYMVNMLGINNRLHIITATRLAVIHQINKNQEELEKLYKKLQLPVELAKNDVAENRLSIGKAYQLGYNLTK